MSSFSLTNALMSVVPSAIPFIMDAIRWDPKILLGIKTKPDGQRLHIYGVGSPTGHLSQRCAHVIPEWQSTKAVQLVDRQSEKRREDINPGHLNLVVFQCLCLTCQPHQHEQVPYAWATAIEASARRRQYVVAAFESIHRATCSSLMTQLETESELVGKFKE